MLQLALSRPTEKRRPRLHEDRKFKGVRLDVIESKIVAKPSSSHDLNCGEITLHHLEHIQCGFLY